MNGSDRGGACDHWRMVKSEGQAAAASVRLVYCGQSPQGSSFCAAVGTCVAKETLTVPGCMLMHGKEMLWCGLG